MKHLLSVIAAIFIYQVAYSQVIITAADMPVAGDTLRYSNASLVGAVISPGDSGVSQLWNYALTFQSQGVDTYKTALEVNILYGLVDPAAYGYKVADSLPIPGLPVSIQQVYTFFEKTTDSFFAKAFAASISGVPTPANYSKADAWYYFPLTYLRSDSSGYALNISIPGAGGLKRTGARQTRVDGWGMLITPYHTTPVNCLRVRSAIHEIDSVTFGGFSFGIPVNTVEYKWLATGEHYPALWVTSTLLTGGGERITSIRYRDSYRDTTTHPPIDTNVAVRNVTSDKTEVKAFPNPATKGTVTLDLPASWKTFFIQVYDMQSKEVATFMDQRELDMRTLPAGQYIARITSGLNVAYLPIMK